MGLAAAAVGNNQNMAAANGINNDAMKIIIYMLSNGLIALSGSLMAQTNGYADLSMGIGTIVIALAAIIIFGNPIAQRAVMGAVVDDHCRRCDLPPDYCGCAGSWCRPELPAFLLRLDVNDLPVIAVTEKEIATHDNSSR